MKRLKTILATVFLLAIGSGLLWGDGVVPTDMNSPEAVVGARKALMHAVKANLDDVAQKLKDGRIKDVQANAQAVDVLARLMPPLFRDTYKEAYNGKGAYFKGAPPDKFEALCAEFSSAAQALQQTAAAGDRGAVQAGMAKVYQQCGLCHKPYRGKF